MRPDMHEVIIERPRFRHGARYPRRWLRNRFRDDEGPSREAMSEGARDKHLNENLAPLVRFLRSRVGTPWSKVRSELSKHLRVTSAVQKHVMDHVKDFVIETTWRDEDGRLWGAHSFGMPYPIEAIQHYRFNQSFYVDPKTGLLSMPPIVAKRRRWRKPPDPNVRELSPSRQLRRIEGHWFDVTIAPMPMLPTAQGSRGVPVWDVVARRKVQSSAVVWNNLAPMADLWRSGRYAQSLRQLSKKEVRALVR